MKKRSSLFRLLGTRSVLVLLLSAVALSLTACGPYYYKFPTYTFANRPVPPSKLANRVMVAVSVDGSIGALAILDGLRDIRNNVQNTVRSYAISGYSSGYPSEILNFPEQVRGYVYSNSDGSVYNVNYSTESATAVSGIPAVRSSYIAVSNDFSNIYAAQESSSQLVVLSFGTSPGSYYLNLPNVYRVAVNRGNSVVLAMVRNSNALYRVVHLNNGQAAPPGSVDCQPYQVPVYCVLPVSGTFDHPYDAYFSVDGTTAYVLNCGPECGGTTAGVSVLQQGPLNYKNIPTSSPEPSPVTATIPVPGGATVALADSTTLYVAGQQQQADGLFAGRLSTISLTTNAVTGTYNISDGFHTKLLFADDNSLWIGGHSCANGERAKLGQNYNCLTRYDLSSQAVSIVPNVVPGGSPTVPYPNSNLNAYYYGDLTGLCWVQNLHKVYTAYGGQVHAFNTTDGSEIDNTNITVQGTALDVAYMDAVTNAAN